MTIIDIQNGSFYITEQIVFTKGRNYYDILNLVPTNETWDVQNGYKWIYLKNIELGKLFFFISVCFHNNKLISIDFGFTDQQKRDSSWEEWSEKDELQRKENYEKWLTAALGNRRNFDWGEIGAYFDPKGGTSSMILRYR